MVRNCLLPVFFVVGLSFIALPTAECQQVDALKQRAEDASKQQAEALQNSPALSVELKQHEQAAAAGDVSAMMSLGLAYETGRGTAIDFAKAAHWYQEAAAKDKEGRAAYRLGSLYACGGKNLPRDEVKAKQWFGQAMRLNYLPPDFLQGIGQVNIEPNRSDLRWELIEQANRLRYLPTEFIRVHAVTGFRLRIAEDPSKDFRGARIGVAQPSDTNVNVENQLFNRNRPQNYYSDSENRPLNYVKAAFDTGLWKEVVSFCDQSLALDRSIQSIYRDEPHKFERYRALSLIELGREQEAKQFLSYSEILAYKLTKLDADGGAILKEVEDIHLAELDVDLLAKFVDADRLLKILPAVRMTADGMVRSIKLCDRLIEKNPQSAAAHFERAKSRWAYLKNIEALERIGKLEPAQATELRSVHSPQQLLDDCDTAMKFGASKPECELLKTTVRTGLAKMQRFVEAAKEKDRVEQQVSQLIETGDVSQAKTEWDRVVDQFPDDWQLRLQRLDNYQQWETRFETPGLPYDLMLVDYARILRTMPQIKELDDIRHRCYGDMVNTLIKGGRFEDALTLINEQWLVEFPEHANPIYYRGLVFYRLEKFEKAFADLNHAPPKNLSEEELKNRGRVHTELSELVRNAELTRNKIAFGRLITEAHELASKDKYREALTSLDKALEMEPNSRDIIRLRAEFQKNESAHQRYLEAQQFKHSGDLEAAEKSIRQALQIRSDSPKLYLELGKILSNATKENRLFEELMAYDRGIALTEQQLVAYAADQQPQSLKDDLFALLVQRATTASKDRCQGDEKRALADLRRALELSPQSALVHLMLGSLHLINDRSDDAERHFVLAKSLDPQTAGYIETLKRTLPARQQQILSLRPHRPNRHLGTGTARLLDQDYVAAELDFDTVIQAEPDNWRAFGLRGQARMYQGQLDDAMQDFRVSFEVEQSIPDEKKSLQERLDLAEYHALLGECLLAKDALFEADVEFTRAEELAPKAARWSAGYADKCFREERFDEAEYRAEIAIGRDPKLAKAQAIYGLCLLKKSGAKKADDSLRKAVELDPRLRSWILDQMEIARPNYAIYGVSLDMEAIIKQAYQRADSDKSRAKDGLETLQTIAEKGNAEAQAWMGMLYLSGSHYSDIPRDPTVAVQWFTKAVALGHAGARYRLTEAKQLAQQFEADKVQPVAPPPVAKVATKEDRLKELGEQSHKLMKQRDYQAAIVLLDEAVALFPEMYAIYEPRAKCNLFLHRDEEVVKDADQMIRIEPNKAGGHALRYFALMMLGRTEEAEKSKARLAELDPKGFSRLDAEMEQLKKMRGN